MSWSFTTSLPTDKDQIRALIGDVDTADQLLSDELINAQLALEPGVYYAASTCAGFIASYFSARGGVDESTMFFLLAKRLRARGANFAAMPYAAGISQSDIDAAKEDSDRPQPSFEVGMHDFERSSPFEDQT